LCRGKQKSLMIIAIINHNAQIEMPRSSVTVRTHAGEPLPSLQRSPHDPGSD
jgi:hypothetical protein